VTPLAALAIGMMAAPISYYAMRFLKRWGAVDESLDVWACHGMGGLWGALATGLFATRSVNHAASDGLFYGHPVQLPIQLAAAVAVALFAFGATYGVARVLDGLMGLRVSDREEEVGLDISEHAEQAYA
jgi:Amt family ammonium transporter